MFKKYTANAKQNNLILGLLLVGIGLLFNEWLLTAIFSPDGELAPPQRGYYLDLRHRLGYNRAGAGDISLICDAL